MNYENTNEILAEHIKNFARQRGISIAKLLHECKLPQSYIQDLKRGRKPNYETVLHIAERLQTSVDYLLGKTPLSEQEYHLLNRRVYGLFDNLSRLDDLQLDLITEFITDLLHDADDGDNSK